MLAIQRRSGGGAGPQNRLLTVLRAALNRAFRDGRVASDEAWRKVRPFREADAAVIHYLSDAERKHLVNATQGRFRDLVCGALVTGCRYGELIRMRVTDLNASRREVIVRLSKAGKPRHVQGAFQPVEHRACVAGPDFQAG
jgi:integrase